MYTAENACLGTGPQDGLQGSPESGGTWWDFGPSSPSKLEGPVETGLQGPGVSSNDLRFEIRGTGGDLV